MPFPGWLDQLSFGTGFGVASGRSWLILTGAPRGCRSATTWFGCHPVLSIRPMTNFGDT